MCSELDPLVEALVRQHNRLGDVHDESRLAIIVVCGRRIGQQNSGRLDMSGSRYDGSRRRSTPEPRKALRGACKITTAQVPF